MPILFLIGGALGLALGCILTLVMTNPHEAARTPELFYDKQKTLMIVSITLVTSLGAAIGGFIEYF
jgi:hypothetical protein